MSVVNATASRTVAPPQPAAARGTSVLQLDHCHTIQTSNIWAAMLFPAIILEGRSLLEILREAETAGYLAFGTSTRVDTMLRTSASGLMFEMRDGRRMLVTALYNGVSEVIVELTDVTTVIEMALSEQRDVLTGLPNRLALIGRCREVLSGEVGALNEAAVLYIDLDRFKAVNDTLGHPVGDHLLKLVCQRIAGLLAPGDVLARFGGDEFAVLQLQGAQPDAAAELANRIIELVGRSYLIDGHPVLVGASVGVALCSTDGKSAEDLIKNADLALFKAKCSGRGMAVFFTEEMDKQIQERRRLEIDLRRALALQEFSLVYQPQFQIDGTRLIGFEALVRWTSADRGTVSPADFIPLAEEIGLIVPLGEWVLRTACVEAASWPTSMSVSVNLSPLQFRSQQLVTVVVSALAKSGLDASRLDLEITEGALMEDTEAVVATLRQIKALGVKISMDDFGTGYSSLSYLQKFPFDKIKIDQSFVRSIETSADSAAIVRAVTALGQSLGMVTIAEGVETEQQLARITRDGCQQVQGFLTGRPLTPEAARKLIFSTRIQVPKQENYDVSPCIL
jgi:diguanylate cyclase (GGDEF)-like protein